MPAKRRDLVLRLRHLRPMRCARGRGRVGHHAGRRRDPFGKGSCNLPPLEAAARLRASSGLGDVAERLKAAVC